MESVENIRGLVNLSQQLEVLRISVNWLVLETQDSSLPILPFTIVGADAVDIYSLHLILSVSNLSKDGCIYT